MMALAAPRVAPIDVDPIKLADRQRMLSQRVVLFALLALRGDGSALPVAQEALAVFRSGHATLTKRAPALTDETLREAVLAITRFIRIAEETLVDIARHHATAERRMHTLVAQATPILGWLDRAVRR